MFAAPRFIAIDDNPAHLAAIQLALQHVGTSSYGIHFKPEEELPAVFTGVRCLFVDLHLLTSLKTSDERPNFANIASIIDNHVPKDSGPFLLVVWTAHPKIVPDLEQYLNETLTGAKPVATLGLPKADFIDLNSGTVKDADRLKKQIENLLGTVPQLAALLDWEQDIIVAAGATLASVLTLVPDNRKDSLNYSTALDDVLSRLACAAVGKHNVTKDPRAAIVQVLLPILSDRISNRWSDGDLDVWKKAVTKHGDESTKATTAEAAEVNRMLHLAPFGVENFGAADWGSVVQLPFDLSDEHMTEHFGIDVADLFKEFKVGDGDRDKVQPVMVRIGAVCDVAQRNRGPIPFLLGLLTPPALKRSGQTTNAIWKSPCFSDEKGIFHIEVHNRLALTVPREVCEKWTRLYRMREPLLMQLIFANAAYGSRPGMIQL